MGWFRLSLQHNESYAFREHPQLTVQQRIYQDIVPDMSGALRPGARRCQGCGELLAKWDDPLIGLVIKKQKYDISVTYDGVVVVSPQFKVTFDQHDLLGLTFRQLPDDPAFLAIYAVKTVKFDAESRKTRFIDKCPHCGRYKSVVGATPVYLGVGSHIDDRELVRTDLEFGSDDEKGPLLLCGALAAQALSQGQLRGLDLIPVGKRAE